MNAHETTVNKTGLNDCCIRMMQIVLDEDLAGHVDGDIYTCIVCQEDIVLQDGEWSDRMGR